ncbi:MAG: hypothetical protein Q8P15_00095 [Nanoarchaeota archaeon]|nr:hypothetical protein [Nanoarchaeota archaeon]
MKVLLDTNFVLTCLKQKIDFVDEIQDKGLKIILPDQVVNELKMLEHRDRTKADYFSALSLKLINESDFKRVDLKDKKTDRGIIKFARKNPEVVIATLDKGIQEKIKNRKLIIRGKKKLEII